MRHVMIDLETLGQRPGCKILSLGAVEFGPAGLGGRFYEVFDANTQAGLHMDVDTVLWWIRQADEAKHDLVSQADKISLDAGLHRFSDWLHGFDQKTVRIWGNGASFDNAILAEAYHRLGIARPWQFYNDRCYRTLKNLAKHIAFERGGTAHRAIDDAVDQANHAVKILNELDVWS